MMAGIPVGAVIAGAFAWFDRGSAALPWWVLSVIPVAGLIVTYGLARTRFWRFGAWFVAGLVLLVGTGELVLREEPHLALFVGVAITLGGMVLRKRDTLALVGVALLSFLTSPWWAGASFSTIDQLVVAGFYVMLALVLGIGLGLRETIERERLDALSKSQARYQGLLEVAFEGLVELRDDCIVALNLGFLEITGRTESELLGRELAAVLTFDAPTKAGERTPTAASSSMLSTSRQRPGTREASGKRPTGEVFYVELVSRTIATERGPVDYVAVRDITPRRHAALQLSIAHRAVALGTLSSGIANEINNPLSWMMTNLQTAQDELRRGGRAYHDAEREALLHTLDDALHGGRRVMSIVRDLKTMSREGSETGIADVHAALDLACRVATRQIEAKARLVRDYGHVPSVRGSAARLGQVFLNLLTNALQAIPDGQRDTHRITLRTRSLRDSVEVIVRDTGSGIAPEVLPHVFDPFYTTKSKDGTGLGLSITRSVIDGMGGTITVESRANEGATFIVRLPVAEHTGSVEDDAPSAARLPSARESLPGGSVPTPEPEPEPATPTPMPRVTRISAPVAIVGPVEPMLRVLIIDDEPLLGKSLRRSLKDYDVTFTEDPARGLELCAESDYDAIVCDLMMPVISGEGVYEHLRERAPELAARVIFMTGGAFTTGSQRFLDRVPHQVLTKPFTPDDLRSAVRRVVEVEREPTEPNRERLASASDESNAS